MDDAVRDDRMTLQEFMPTPQPDGDEDFVARAGAPIDPAQTPVAGHDAMVEAMCSVYDPEIPVNIYDLGLIYEFEIGADGNVTIEMTLTAPACPVAGTMPGMVAEAVARVCLRIFRQLPKKDGLLYKRNAFCHWCSDFHHMFW